MSKKHFRIYKRLSDFLTLPTWNSNLHGHTFKDYQHIANYTKYGLNFVTQANISCCIYDIQMLDAKPFLTSDFIHDLEHLSDEYVEYIYRK